MKLDNWFDIVVLLVIVSLLIFAVISLIRENHRRKVYHREVILRVMRKQKEPSALCDVACEVDEYMGNDYFGHSIMSYSRVTDAWEKLIEEGVLQFDSSYGGVRRYKLKSNS